MSRFDDLLDGYLHDAPTADEAAELQQLLHDDAACRRMFADRMLFEIQLHKAFATAETADRPVRRSWPMRRLLIGSTAVAAILLLAVGVAWWGRGERDRNTVTALANEVTSGEVRVDGSVVKTLPDEKTFEVAGDGPAVIQLADGSQAELAPSSKALIHGKRPDVRESVELQQGGGKFTVTSGDSRFRVETPVGTITVLGTEFSVKLQPRGKAEGKRERGRSRGRLTLAVTVTQGSVRVDVKGTSHTLTAGMSRTFGDERREEDDD